ncbi:signal recognition particle, SRP9/SRP14 subunit, partial [Earliella scabrosa]
MVYISSWQEYQEAAEALYEKSPNTTRYCVKWRQATDGAGKLVLKITDNTTCLKFKTHSSVFLNRFDALNLALMQKMQNRRPTQASTAPSTSQ